MINRSQKILVAPLDWGLGHATRCIPIIRTLLENGTEVVVCASGPGRLILQEEFPQINFIDIPGIKIKYPGNGNMALTMIGQLPGILRAIHTEHNLLEKYIKQLQLTHVISDNRYGLYSKTIKSTFITHQVRISAGNNRKYLEPVLFWINKYFIERFHELWIPDLPPPENLSGNLSVTKGISIPVRYTGLLSRFNGKASAGAKTFDYIAMLSGPEPQRSFLEKKVMEFFINSKKSCLMIQGLPGNNVNEQSGSVQIVSSIPSESFSKLLHPDTVLIARSGYSTLMDLTILQHSNVWLIPTPGQTEQEYLASYMKQRFGFYVINQDDPFPLQPVRSANPVYLSGNSEMLKKIVQDFIV